MAYVVKMSSEALETVVVAHQFTLVMVPLIFQTGNKSRLNKGAFTTLHNKVRCRFCQMKTPWMYSICYVYNPDDYN